MQGREGGRGGERGGEGGRRGEGREGGRREKRRWGEGGKAVTGNEEDTYSQSCVKHDDFGA